MFKNIEIAVINKKAVLESSWGEFGALCVCGYLIILSHLLINQPQSVENATLNNVFIGLFVLAWFLYISFFYWGFLWAFDWLVEWFFITNTASERRVYLLFCIELLTATVVIYLTRNHTPIGEFWRVFLALLIVAKLVRIFILKRKNKWLNQVK
jgi:hypothetical protein